MSYALNAKRGHRDDGESETFVAAPLMFGSSRGGPNSLRPGFTGDGHIVSTYAGHGEGEADVANSLIKPSRGSAWKGGSSDVFVVAAPLTADGHPNSNTPGRRKEDDENLVATSITLASDPISARELAQPSTRRNGDPGVVQYGASVRRLTPTECERLQGLPDGWTDLGGTPDSRRYAALGDAVTATVGYWIGRRIVEELAR